MCSACAAGATRIRAVAAAGGARGVRYKIAWWHKCLMRLKKSAIVGLRPRAVERWRYKMS
jgi:ureidoglycolate hydrolase